MPGALDAFGLRLPQPAWRVLDAIRAHGFTGELLLTGSPPVRIYADRGRIYLAEPVGLAPLGPRLVASGALTPDEYARGMLRVDGDDRLDALFARVPSVDRHVVTATVSAMTDAALRGIAGQVLAAAEVLPYTYHPSGVHLWEASSAANTGPTAPGSVPPGAAPAQPVFTSPAGGRPSEPAPAPYWPCGHTPDPARSSEPAAPPQPSAEPAAPAARVTPTDTQSPEVEFDDERFADIVRWEESPYVHEVSRGLVDRPPNGHPSAAPPADRPTPEPAPAGDELGEFEVIWPDGDVEPTPAATSPHGAQGHLPADDRADEPAWSADDDNLAVRRAVAMIDTGSLTVRRRILPDQRP